MQPYCRYFSSLPAALKKKQKNRTWGKISPVGTRIAIKVLQTQTRCVPKNETEVQLIVMNNIGLHVKHALKACRHRGRNLKGFPHRGSLFVRQMTHASCPEEQEQRWRFPSLNIQGKIKLGGQVLFRESPSTLKPDAAQEMLESKSPVPLLDSDT